jgi:adenosylcobinamide-GDP ribazoletransferase
MLAGLVGLLALAGLMRLWAQRRLGGVTGDILGAIQVLGEVGFSLGVLACL